MAFVKLTALVLVSTGAFLVVRTDPRPMRPDQALLAVSWVQHAAEHDALCRQTYNTARAMLGVAKSDPTWTAALEQAGQQGLSALPPAVIVDVDETVLDNSPYNAWLVEQSKGYTPASWEAWVDERQAAPIPGAVGFLTDAASQGVTVFYVTNRSPAEEAATRANLRAIGCPLLDTDDVDVVLTKGEQEGWTGDKTTRRAAIAATHRILMLIGDDLGDFIDGVSPDRARTTDAAHVDAVRRYGAAFAADRAARLAEHASWWGTRWFVLPNPMYGSWLSVLEAQTAHVFEEGDPQRGTASKQVRGVLSEGLATRETAVPRDEPPPAGGR